MHILVLNSGSSSIKYQLFDMQDRTTVASGLVERIGEASSRHTSRVSRPGAMPVESVSEEPVADHDGGFTRIVATLADAGLGDDLAGIGHRVVHGGEAFAAPAVIDADVIAGIHAQIPLAPLHNPANLRGIEVAYGMRPDLPQVAVFDTAFHADLPASARSYALPGELAGKLRIRRYGFHGTSHAFVARRAAEHLGLAPGQTNVITLHLGNGASAAAVRGGRSVDTSMGLSPLEGLVMGTRSGDLDPAIVFHLIREGGMTPDDVEELLNRASGLKGLCGENDMRRVEARAGDGDDAAALALDLYCYRIRKYVGAYMAVLGRVDALVFTAGIGENSPQVRARACAGLERLGVEIDAQRNERRAGGEVVLVSSDASAVAVLVVPTNEELEIAEQTLACVSAG